MKREVEREVEWEVKREVDKLTKHQKLLLKLMEEEPFISKKEMSEIIGIRSSSIDKNIQALKKKGFLRRVGPARGGHWEVLKK